MIFNYSRKEIENKTGKQYELRIKTKTKTKTKTTKRQTQKKEKKVTRGT